MKQNNWWCLNNIDFLFTIWRTKKNESMDCIHYFVYICILCYIHLNTIEATVDAIAFTQLHKHLFRVTAGRTTRHSVSKISL